MKHEKPPALGTDDRRRTIGDLYLAGALMARGFALVGTTREGARVSFQFGGDGIDEAVLQYTNGTLVVNAARFVHALDRLRTLITQERR